MSLLKDEHGELPDLDLVKVAKEKLAALTKEAATAAAAAAIAATTAFNALSDKDLHDRAKQIAVDIGFDPSRQKWVVDLFDPDNCPYDLNNETFKIEREKWELIIKSNILEQSKEWEKMSKDARVEAFWIMREEMQVLREKRDAHDRKLPNGNMDVKTDDG